jgi:hypothetical protein
MEWYCFKILCFVNVSLNAWVDIVYQDKYLIGTRIWEPYELEVACNSYLDKKHITEEIRNLLNREEIFSNVSSLKELYPNIELAINKANLKLLELNSQQTLVGIDSSPDPAINWTFILVTAGIMCIILGSIIGIILYTTEPKVTFSQPLSLSTEEAIAYRNIGRIEELQELQKPAWLAELHCREK